MRKTLIIGIASASLMLFSCGETVSSEELEAVKTEIKSAQDELDAMDAKSEEIDQELKGLEEDLNDM